MQAVWGVSVIKPIANSKCGCKQRRQQRQRKVKCLTLLMSQIYRREKVAATATENIIFYFVQVTFS